MDVLYYDRGKKYPNWYCNMYKRTEFIDWSLICIVAGILVVAMMMGLLLYANYYVHMKMVNAGCVYAPVDWPNGTFYTVNEWACPYK